ncbi:MAG TPA: 4'-phosphopantetheinyl transferase superfamily protein [Puia sp.]|nr:4'-phosphopantetheinyl transferase superfamily protein [Puia sp.]
MPTVYCNSIDHIIWEESFHGSFFNRNQVQVWRIPVISDQELLIKYESFLDPDESAQARAFHQEKDNRRFITSRAALRFLLGKYLGKKPAEIRFGSGKNKKPILPDNEPLHLHYNVSHSGDWILFAMADIEIGIDIEKIDDQFGFEEILATAFSQDEIDYLQKQKNPSETFYLWWTRKESMSKATGKGIDDNLRDIPCLDGLHQLADEIAGSVQAWAILSFPVEKQYIASLAYDSAIQHLRFAEINPHLVVQ